MKWAFWLLWRQTFSVDCQLPGIGHLILLGVRVFDDTLLLYYGPSWRQIVCSYAKRLNSHCDVHVHLSLRVGRVPLTRKSVSYLVPHGDRRWITKINKAPRSSVPKVPPRIRHHGIAQIPSVNRV
jgi:hypothetical protein